MVLCRVTSKPSEFLVVGRKGRLSNLGPGASALVWPWNTWVTVPAARQEAPFELTQETLDGIPLRMKGIIVYRIVDPLAAAMRFDFSTEGGHGRIAALLAHVALGELRAVATRMTMKECIEERKTVLTGAVASALESLVGRGDDAWGLALEFVQVAQVFIVDAELRRKLEADVRAQVTAKSELAEIRMKAEISEAQAGARRAELERRRELYALEAEQAQRALELQSAEVELELTLDRAKQRMRLEALPIEQVPQIAEALGRAYQGAQLSIYGADASSFAGLAQLVDLVGDRLRGTASPGP